MNFTILHFDSIDSTNTEALNQAKRGAAEGLCVTANQQTAGRGRHGRTWISPKDAGLYFSIVLRPRIETRLLPLLTLMSAVAVHDALEELFKIECDIKWANDIHVRDKKICGILAETGETSKGLAVIVGVGINLKSLNFPPELEEIATSIEAETGKFPDAKILLQTMTRRLSEYYDLLQSEGGAEKIRAAWARKSSYFAGKSVKVSLANKTIYGTTRGIEDNGALRVETADGAIKIIHAGDVERVRAVRNEK
ncbi:MAG TPA: biotin--[acetyl-CoA-carboxylase] ligase [Pyrinomonadaceae bacterium]